MVVTVKARLQGMDPRLEEAARDFAPRSIALRLQECRDVVEYDDIPGGVVLVPGQRRTRTGKDALADFAAQARVKIGDDLKLSATDRFDFCWIVDFPMFEWNEDEQKIDFSHNPFSMPQGGLEALDAIEPEEILAYQYDLVCNGVELSSGAIRNHKPEIMRKAFAIAGDWQMPDVIFGHDLLRLRGRRLG